MNILRTFLARLNFKKNSRSFGFGTSPEADWEAIFILTVAFTLLVIMLNIFIFIKIDKREIFVAERPVERGEETLDISILKETVSYYQNKALEFERIKNTRTPAIDPSL